VVKETTVKKAHILGHDAPSLLRHDDDLALIASFDRGFVADHLGLPSVDEARLVPCGVSRSSWLFITEGF